MRVCVGDKITALGLTFEVGKILYQDCYKGNYDVEFLDVCGGYHHWKSEFDGGHIVLKGEDK